MIFGIRFLINYLQLDRVLYIVSWNVVKICQICTLNWDVEVGGNSQTAPRHSISCLFPFWYNRLASDRRQAVLQHHVDDILLCLERRICVLKQYVHRESVLNNRISLYHFWRLNLSILSLPASHLCHQGLSWPCIFVRSTYQQVFWSRDYRSNFHQGQYLLRGGELTNASNFLTDLFYQGHYLPPHF